MSWNVNSWRSMENDQELFGRNGYDIILLQETKLSKSTLHSDLVTRKNYLSSFNCSERKKGYSGTALFSHERLVPISIQTNFLTEHFEERIREYYKDKCENVELLICEIKEQLLSEGRFIAGKYLMDKKRKEHEKIIEKDIFELYSNRFPRSPSPTDENYERTFECLHVINVYCPMYSAEDNDESNKYVRIDKNCGKDEFITRISNDRLNYKTLFFFALQCYLEELIKQQQFFIICGDFNISRRYNDSAKFSIFNENEMKFDRFQNWINRLVFEDYSNDSFHDETILSQNKIENILIDTFRHLHPKKKDVYTCWNQKTRAYETNYGSRIDYIFCSRSLEEYVIQSEILSDHSGSDHVPVMATFNIKLRSSNTIPSGMRRRLLEQQKISTLFNVLPKNDSKKEQQIGETSKRKVRDDVIDVTAPKCWKHKEHCLERTVIKQNSQNINRKFYVCRKPEGRPDDIKAKCNFFMWKDEWIRRRNKTIKKKV
ncbi:hypothetical protein SNEBB_003852 [Seison nebaliae]|nr:hypothetical protein SNEBB_003852 [Seison nebaliae]